MAISRTPGLDWDVKLVGDRWHDILVRTATEELGWPDRFTRARCKVCSTLMTRVSAVGTLIWSAVAVASGPPWASLVGLVLAAAILTHIRVSRRRCLDAVFQLLGNAGAIAELQQLNTGKKDVPVPGR